MGANLNPFEESRKPPLPAVTGGQPQKQEPRLWGAGLGNLSQTSDGYLAGAFDWSVVEAPALVDFLWCFL